MSGASRVLVTGAASGIGRSVSEHLAAGGAAVAGLDRNAAALAAMVEESQSFATTVIGVAADVAVFQEVAEAISTCSTQRS